MAMKDISSPHPSQVMSISTPSGLVGLRMPQSLRSGHSEQSGAEMGSSSYLNQQDPAPDCSELHIGVLVYHQVRVQESVQV